MNTLKQRLKAGEFVAAAWAELGSPDVAEILVRHGWPVIVIDGEHGIGELETWVAMARAIEAAGGEVVLRVPEGSETVLKRVLDRGFRSIIVPMVHTPEQARAVADFCRYPPRGQRGYAAPIVRASQFGVQADYARDRAHEDTLLMVQCEHHIAVDNLREIAAVEGIDAIFLGPNDLSASIGHLERMEEPEPQALFARVESEAAASGTLLATIQGAGRNWQELRSLGYRFVVGPNDISLLIASARQAVTDRDQELTGRTAETSAQPRY
ncbi:HpcH/HpaI aldolase family protein [Jiella marina]|uniref:HpcH/HpaI aldolase family protein n=1 Tax=Jiella sp. LLJ827 TaxID=2917712 RepID=UPI00210097A9|nr:aldolase/citrate lyase family protein [Jiella sp. LLJ827]MCQ0988570.1 aldolase/citrate lyase family protein [Jiella sp. LLJ827]